MRIRVIRCLALALMGGFALPTMAAYHWDFATGSALIKPNSFCGGSQTFTYGNCDTWNSTASGGPAVDVKAYSTTGTPTGSTGKLEAAYLDVYTGGLGVTNRLENTGPSSTGTSALYPLNQAHPTTSAPNHAIDNSGNTDSVLLNFKTSVNLTGILLGWPTSSSSCSPVETNCDTDVQIWAYTGGGGSPDPLGKTYSASLAAAGWTLVNTYLNVPVGTTKLVNGAATVDAVSGFHSQYWMVSAAYSGTALLASQNDLDFLKLQAVYGTEYHGAPEPGSLALLVFAMAGGMWVRRTKAG
jgi:hypothetical protein